MATQVYKVRDPSGAIREIEGPAGATDDQVIAKAKELFAPEASATPERSLYEKFMGNVETIPALASGLAAGVVAPIAGVASTLTSGKYGTQEGIRAGEQTARNVQEAMTYQPRTPEAQRNVQVVGDVLSNVIPIAPTNMLPAAAILAKPSLNQLAPAVAPIKNAMVSATQRQPAAVMPGMGAAETSAAALRQERALRQDIRLTKGEQNPELGLQQFESDIVKKNPELGKPLIEFKAGQKQDIIDRIEKLAGETNAQYADPANARAVGTIVDKAMVNEYGKKFDAYKQKYKIADNAGETLQEVSYKDIIDFIEQKTPTMRQKLDPILDSVAESLKMNDPTGKGTISIRALEDIFQEVGQVKGSANAKELKGLIDQATEGAGGDLYRQARTARRQLANEFDNNYRVAKLLDTKGKYADRAVAFDDVFKHVVLDGSLEEMRTVTKILKKGGPEGQQAYKELQGQTIQHLKDLLIKGEGELKPNSELSFAKFKSAIDSLDREGKLEYMYGKAGRDKLMDLRATVQDALVKDPRAVNWSNSGNVVLRGLDALAALRFPGAQKAAEIAQNVSLKKKVAESVNYNALAPKGKPTNALAP